MKIKKTFRMDADVQASLTELKEQFEITTEAKTVSMIIRNFKKEYDERRELAEKLRLSEARVSKFIYQFRTYRDLADRHIESF